MRTWPRRIRKALSEFGPQLRSARLDPAADVPVSGAAILDRLEQTFELVGIVGALDFEAVAVLVVVDQGAGQVAARPRPSRRLAWPM